MTERLAGPDKFAELAEAVADGRWLKERFPDKDWHQHRRGRDGSTQWCDGTPSDCKTKERL